jgi:hypothetical protein
MAHEHPKMPSPAATLPAPELDDYEQFAARIRASKRTVIRLVAGGMPVIYIGRLPRIDPIVGMAYIRGELPPPEPPRRGRPKKDSATASRTAATAVARRPKLRLHDRTRGSL